MKLGVGSPVAALASMLALGLLLVSVAVTPAAENEEGFKPIFDGKTLNGWDGDPKLWTVEDGAITGRTNDEDPLKTNQFIIWRQGI